MYCHRYYRLCTVNSSESCIIVQGRHIDDLEMELLYSRLLQFAYLDIMVRMYVMSKLELVHPSAYYHNMTKGVMDLMSFFYDLKGYGYNGLKLTTILVLFKTLIAMYMHD